jgi:hypothetical protein
VTGVTMKAILNYIKYRELSIQWFKSDVIKLIGQLVWLVLTVVLVQIGILVALIVHW